MQNITRIAALVGFTVVAAAAAEAAEAVAAAVAEVASLAASEAATVAATISVLATPKSRSFGEGAEKICCF